MWFLLVYTVQPAKELIRTTHCHLTPHSHNSYCVTLHPTSKRLHKLHASAPPKGAAPRNSSRKAANLSSEQALSYLYVAIHNCQGMLDGFELTERSLKPQIRYTPSMSRVTSVCSSTMPFIHCRLAISKLISPPTRSK